MLKKIFLWEFAGVGAVVIGIFLAQCFNNDSNPKQTQKIRGESNVVAGRDVNLINRDKDTNKKDTERNKLVNSFCILFDIWDQSIKSQNSENDLVIASKATKLTLADLPDGITWEAARSGIVKASESSGFKKGMLQADASKKLGDLMVPNGKYIKDGEEKTSWLKCGVIMADSMHATDTSSKGTIREL